MSSISPRPDQSTTTEAQLLTALFNLATSDASQAIQKSSTGFANISILSASSPTITGMLTVIAAGTGTSLTNPVITAVNSVNNFTQISIQNKTAGVNSSADLIAYGDNNTDDTTGFADIGFTSSAFSQSAYAITAKNDGYFFVSAVSGAGKTGNMVIATDGTGSANNIIFFTGGFDLTTRERMRISSSGVRFGLIGTSTGTLLLSGATSGTTTVVANTAAGSGTLTLPVGTGTIHSSATANNFGAFTAYFTVTDNGNSGTSKTVDWTLGNKQKITMTGNCTFTFTAPAGPASLVFELIGDGTVRTPVWPAGVKWSGATAPTLTGTSGKSDIITFYYNGTVYYGNSSLNYVNS